MTKVIVRRLLGGLALGAALLVPTLALSFAAAQGRSDHGGRHDNGLHRGWDKGGRGDRDDQDRRDRDWDRRDRDRQARDQRERDRRDRERRDRDRDRRNRDDDRRRDIEATRRRMDLERARIAQNRDQARRDRERRDRDWRDGRGNDRRQAQKNQWRNLGYAGGATGLYGLLSGNRTIAALGLGGGLYSAYRYEQDRKSQNRDARGRYDLFRRTSFDHQGHHYERRTKNQGGQRYYYFQRTR